MRISLVLAVLLGGVVGPAVAETAAYATVYDSCDMPRCADARAAHDEWAGYGYPTTRGWHPWSGGQSNFAGGQFFNYEGQLPAGATYYEYDVYPRAEGPPATRTASSSTPQRTRPGSPRTTTPTSTASPETCRASRQRS
ncbi:hypothetical protein ACFQX7_39500 [Luedemannella flava]